MKLQIEMIPQPTWSNNLRTKMGRYRWRKLRAQVLEEQRKVCVFCGSEEWLQVHEVWDFDDGNHVQTLRGFQVVCTACHLASHIGMAGVLAAQGDIDIENVIAHFCKVNGVTPKEFEKHRAAAGALWRERSKHQWRIDLGRWVELVPSA